MRAALAAFMLLTGGGFILLAAVGVARMPDLFTRLQATSKAATLGVGCLMLGVMLYSGEPGTALRAGLVVLLFFLTAPVAAHVIARASYFVGTRLWRGTVIDELRGHYDERTHRLESGMGDRS